MIGASGGSQVPAFALAGSVLGAVVLLGGAGWLWHRTRGAHDVTVRAVIAGLGGLSATLFTLFAAGMRHYGGSVDVGGGQVRDNCSVWWDEAGLPSGQKAVAGDFSASCRHAAIAAIGPAALLAALVGLAVAVVVFGLLIGGGRRRRPARVRETVVE